jgi:hypothetical protein
VSSAIAEMCGQALEIRMEANVYKWWSRIIPYSQFIPPSQTTSGQTALYSRYLLFSKFEIHVSPHQYYLPVAPPHFGQDSSIISSEMTNYVISLLQ